METRFWLRSLAMLALALAFVACTGAPPGNGTTTPSIGGITVGPATPVVQIGEDISLVVAFTGVKGSPDLGITWSIDDESVATVDADGVVTGVAAGTATVTATSVFAPAVSGSVTITVTAPTADGTGCPSASGFSVSGAVRIATLHPTPRVTGPSVVVKFPCGREVDDPAKATCGTGAILVWLCTTPDCSAASDPVRYHRNPAGSLVQSSFDKEPFEFCGLSGGTYYVLPIIDHDDSGGLSDFDWTMGRKNLADAGTAWPAQPLGHEVAVTADVALGTGLVPTSPDFSPVVVDFFHYVHPTPARQAEDAWLFAVASLDPTVSATGVGVRAVDLRDGVERDFIPATPTTDARSIERPDGGRYVGDLQSLAFHDGVAYLAADTRGVIFSVRLGADGSVVQGPTIDLRDTDLALGAGDVMQHGAVMRHSNGRTYLAITQREDRATLPHRPANPLLLVDVTDLEDDGTFTARAVTSALIPELDKVRLDAIVAHGDLWFAAETGGNSDARRTDDLNRVWVLRATTEGAVEHEAYAGEPYNPEADVPECGGRPPYRTAGLWAGEMDGATHAILGGLRDLFVFRFPPDSVAGGARVRSGTGVDATDLRLDDHAIGFSLMRASPDGSRLFVFGDCKSRYLAVREADWAGASGSRTQSRRRIAVLDLTSVDADGLPRVDLSYGDRLTAPDVVRTSLAGANIVLDADIVRGIGMDCRGVLWDIYDAFGYLNVAGSTFGADCVANRAADAVVTDHHIYVIGAGSVAAGATGLGVASEVWVFDLATGREVLSPGWQWVYDGSAYQTRYGYFGLTLGERENRDVARALFLVP